MTRKPVDKQSTGNRTETASEYTDQTQIKPCIDKTHIVYPNQKTGRPNAETITRDAGETHTQHDMCKGWKPENIPQGSEQSGLSLPFRHTYLEGFSHSELNQNG